ncbi:high mobility group B protein 14-like [Chenopodium quinoa]|uniref:high mobility group B protein 14-like n=1 Tax=Chenopodium quinoa TaxID=63459 RepID=UPI000B794C8D|nr:high mobility group B protein 14-like [Chenopodium quinoa]
MNLHSSHTLHKQYPRKIEAKGKKMAKRASKSTTSNSINGETTNTTPKRKITFRIPLSQNSLRKSRDEEEGEKEARSSSSKRSKSSLKKKKVDPNKPKKPPTAFFFLEDFRRGYQDENPEVKSMRDIGKACGEKWKIMTYEEKVKYYDIATEKRAKFDKAMAEYIRRKESGEGAESENSESDFNLE